MKNRITAILFVAIMIFTLTALASCGDSNTAANINKDREGNSITLPENINTIASIGPSNTEILVALGLSDKIIATDTYSTYIEGLKSDLPLFDMWVLDAEQMVSIQPDVVFVTGMAKVGGEDTYAPVKSAGICVIYIPSSESIQGIKEDIQFIADVMNLSSKGKDIIKDMEKEIDEIKKIGDTITEKKSVYFEMEPAPSMYSFGSGVFLNEMIEIIGAKNIFANQTSWLSVTEESILEANPDVIMTSVNYIDNPVEEIKARPGWEAITAVANNSVYSVDANMSSQPTHNIVKALKEMAKIVYPDLYK